MARPTLLPIGAFSTATQLSAKALRLYAEQDILTPAHIDAETGYRYYRQEQVHDARLVRLLRELDVPLADIASLLANPGDIERWLKRHMDQLSQRFTQQQAAFHTTLALLRTANPPAIQAVLERFLPKMQVLTHFFEADSHTLMVRTNAVLMQLSAEYGAGLLDCDAAFIHLSAPLGAQDEVTLELCVPITGPITVPLTHASRDCPAQSMACVNVTMQDGGTNLVAASDALFDWFDRNGATLVHAPLIFFQGRELQLAWPISR